MRSATRLFQVLACCLPLAACHESDSRRDRPAPPDTSYRSGPLLLTMEGTSHGIRSAFVTPDFIKAVREQPLLGRTFIAEEHQPKGQPVVVLSHGLWQQRFGSDPAVIGRSVALDGRAYTVVGVMPKGFDTPAGAEAWLPEAGTGR